MSKHGAEEYALQELAMAKEEIMELRGQLEAVTEALRYIREHRNEKWFSGEMLFALRAHANAALAKIGGKP